MIISQAHPEFDAIQWDRWVPTDQATLCFVLQNQQVLLIEKQRGLGAGKVNGPGGKFDPGETAAECAVRETQEELGVTPKDLEHRGLLRFEFTNGYKLEAHIFLAHDHEGEAVETEEAIPLWTDLDSIPYRRMWADDVLWLPHVLAGQSVKGDFLFDDEEMLGVSMELMERL
ncbi:8-oxo-dGTP diphosphatase [Kiritimatiellaeota bacterium B1221]|nr:8-oxo-dGTP diphosphatase [Kiritimatiellaeota bacterium B1221]